MTMVRSSLATRVGTTMASAARRSLLAGSAVVVGVVPAAHANPEGGTVIAGQATIQQTAPNRVDIVQGSERAVLDWRSFNIGADEHTNFQQPSSSSIALNRIRQGDPSRIDGRLTANGTVVLMNPAGIVFGAGAAVDVGGLVATSADIDADRFMSGREELRFDRPGNADARIVNEGRITAREAGIAALVAPGVENRGVIEAELGQVTLAGAESFALDLHGDGLIWFQVGSNGGSGRVDSSGRISANGGRVLLTADQAAGVVEDVVNVSGLVEARTVRREGGEIVLDGGQGRTSVTGTLAATGDGAGDRGGRVAVTGRQVGIFDGAVVDASGEAGGGEIQVGGGWQGRDARVRNAEATVVAPTARLAADARAQGDGGEIAIWSNAYTNFAGRASARGGDAGGDGGRVETSSVDLLIATGAVDAAAPRGRAGDWLLDPTNLEVRRQTTSGGAFNGANPSVFTPDASATAVVDTATINAALSAGTSVTLTTASAGGGAGDVRFFDRIEKTGGGTATLRVDAIGNIVVDALATIQSTVGALNLDFNAGGSITSNAAVIVTQGGTVDFAAGAGVTNASAIVTTGGAFLSTGTSFTGSGNIQTGAGAITLAHTGAVALTGQLLTSSGAITVGGASFASSLGGQLATAGGSVAVTATGAASFGAGIVTQGGGVTITAASFDNTGGGFTTSNPGLGGGAVALNVTGPVTIGSAIDTGMMSGGITIADSATTVTLAAILTAGTGGVSLGANDIVLAATTQITANGAVNLGTTLNDDAVGGSDRDLTVAAGTGTVTIGTVGGTVGPRSLTVSGRTLAFTGATITADTQTYTASGAGGGFTVRGDTDVTFTAAANLSFLGGLALTQVGGTTGNLTLGSTGGGTVSVGPVTGGGGTGDLLIASVGGAAALGAVTGFETVTATAGTVTLNGDVTSGTGGIDVNGNVTLGQTVVLTGGGGAVDISGTIDAATAGVQALTIAAGTQPVTINAPVGAGTALGALTVTAGAITTDAGASITANTGAVSLTATNAVLVQAPISAVGITLSGSTVTTTAAAPLASGTGALRLVAGTAGTAFAIGAGLSGFGTATFAVRADGPADLEIGGTTVAGAVQIPVAVLDQLFNGFTLVRFETAGTATLTAPPSAGWRDGLAIQAANILVNTVGITTPDANDQISLLATGTTTLAAGGDLLTSGGAVTVTGTLTKSAAAGTTLINTTNGGVVGTAAISLGTVNFAGAGNNLTLNGGTGGAVTIAAVTAADVLTVTNASSFTATGAVTANTVSLQGTGGLAAFRGNLTVNTGLIVTGGVNVLQITGTTNSIAGTTSFLNTGLTRIGDGVGDTTTFTGGFSDPTVSAVETAGTIAVGATGDVTLGSLVLLANTAFTGTGADDVAIDSVTGGGFNLSFAGFDLTTVTGAATGLGTLGFGAATSGYEFQGDVTATALTTVAGSGAVSLRGANTQITGPAATAFVTNGAVTLGDGAGDSLTFAGGVSVTGAAALNLAGTIATANAAITFNSLATLTAATALSSGGGAITTTGLASGGNALTLIAGTGAINLNGAASFTGGGDLTVTSAGSLTVAGSVAAGVVTLTQVTGASAFQGDVTATDLVTTATVAGLSLTGATNGFTQQVAFLNAGALLLGDAATDSFAFTGGVSATGGASNPSSVTLAGQFSGGTGLFGPVTLGADVTYTVGGNSLTFGTITGGGNDLSVTGATVTLGAAGGLTSLTANGNGATDVLNLTGDVAVTGPIAIGGTNAVETVALAATVDLSATGAGGSITITGTTNLTVAGPGTSVFTGQTGIAGAGTTVTAASGVNLSFVSDGTITLAGITTTAPAGTLGFQPLTQGGAVGVNSAAAGFNVSAATLAGIANVYGAVSLGGVTSGAVRVGEDGAIDLAGAGRTYDLTLTGGAGGTGASISGALTLAPTTTLTLDIQSGTATQTAPIVGGNLLLRGGATFNLVTATNDVIALAAAGTGPLTYRDATDLTVGTVGGVAGITTASQAVSLQTGGLLTLGTGAGEDLAVGGATVDLNTAGVADGAGSGVLAAGLRLQGTGSFVFDSGASDVDVLAANVTGALTFVDLDSLAVGTLLGTAGVASGNADITLQTGAALSLTQNVTAGAAGVITLNVAAGGVSQTGGAVTGAALRLLGAGDFVLAQTTNDVDTLAAAIGTGRLQVRDADTLTVGTVAGTAGIAAGTAGIKTGQLLTLANAITVTDTADLFALAGGVTQNTGATITAPNLLLRGVGTYLLNGATNSIGTVAGSVVGEIRLTEADALTVGRVAGVDPTETIIGIITASGDVTLTAGGALTIADTLTLLNGTLRVTSAGATQAAGATVTATALGLRGTGTFTLTEAANVLPVLAADTVGAVTLRTSGALAIGTVAAQGTDFAGATGANTGANGLTLTAGGAVTQTAAIGAGSGVTLLTVATRTAGGANVTLLNATNNVATLDLASLDVAGTGLTDGDLAYRDATGFVVASLRTTGQAALQAGGSVTQTGAITTGGDAGEGLELLGAGPYTLTTAGNVIPILAVNTTEAVELVSSVALTVGTSGATTGITTTGDDVILRAAPGIAVNAAVTLGAGDLTLDSATGATQTAAITAAGLRLLGAGTFTLANAGNDVATLAAATPGGLTYVDASALSIGTVEGTAGVTLAGDGSITAGGALTIGAGAGEDLSTPGNLTLQSTATTQLAGSLISASGLRLLGTSATLTNANTVTTLAATLTAGLSYTDADALTVGTVLGTAGVTAGGPVVLTTGGLLTLGSGAGEDIAAAGQTVDLAVAGLADGAGSGVLAAGLRITSSARAILESGATDIDTLAGNVTGSLTVVDLDDLTVGTVLGTNGVTVSADAALTAATTLALTQAANVTGTLTLSSGTGTSQTATGLVTAAGLRLLGAGPVVLNQAGNQVTTLAANTGGAITLSETGGFTVGSLLGTAGITTSDDAVTLSSTGALVLGSGAGEDIVAGTATVDLNAASIADADGSGVLAAALRLQGTGAVTLDSGVSNVATLAAVVGGALIYVDADALTVGTVLGTNGITTGNNATLVTGGALSIAQPITVGAGTLTLQTLAGGVTQTAAITGTNLLLLGSGPATLTNVGNAFGTLAANLDGALAYTDADALVVGTVGGTAGITTTNDDVTLTTAALTLGSGAGEDIAAGTATVRLTVANVTDAAGSGVRAARLQISSTAGATLDNTDNDVDTLAVASTGGAVAFTDADDLTVGTVDTAGIVTGGQNLTLVTGTTLLLDDDVTLGAGIASVTAGGAVTQNAGDDLTGAAARFLGAGPVTLANAGNDVDTLAANLAGGGLTFQDGDGLVVGTVLGTAGVTAAGPVVLTAGAALTLGAGAGEDVTAAGFRVTLTSTNTTNAAANSVVVAQGLELLGGPASLTGANDVDDLAANLTGALAFNDADDLRVGTVGATAGITTGGNTVTLTVTGPLTLGSGAGEDIVATGSTVDLTAAGVGDGAGSGILAANLRLQGTGAFALDSGATNIDVLAASVTGALTLTDSDGLTVGTVLGTNGITTGGNDATLNTGGPIAIAQAITLGAGNLTLNATGGATQTAAMTGAGLRLLGTGPYTLTNAGNAFATLAGALTGDVSYTDADGLVVGTVLGTAGLTTGGGTANLVAGGALTIGSGAGEDIALGAGNLLITAAGAVTDATGSTITAAGLRLSGTGTALLDEASDIDSFATDMSGGSVALRDIDGFTIGTVGGTVGAQIGTGALTLRSDAGTVTQTHRIVAGALTLNGGASFTLNSLDAGLTAGTDNDVASLGGSVTGALAFSDESALALDTLSVGGAFALTTDDAVTQTGGATLAVTGPAAFNVQNPGATITLANAGNALAGLVTFTTADGAGNSGNATLVNGVATRLGASGVDGALDVTSAGTLTVEGNLAAATLVDLAAAGTLTFNGGTAVTAGTTLEATSAADLIQQATNTLTGTNAVRLDAGTAITLAGTTGTNGPVTIGNTTANLAVALSGTVTANATGDGTATLSVLTGAGGTITQTAGTLAGTTGGVRVDGGAVTLISVTAAGGNTVAGTTTSIAGGSAAIVVRGAGAVSVTGITATGGRVDLNAGQGLALGAVTAAGQTVFAQAGTRITDANGTAVNVTAGTLDARAVTGIGALANGTVELDPEDAGSTNDPLETAIATLLARTSGANSEISIDNTGALTVAALSTGGTGVGAAYLRAASLALGGLDLSLAEFAGDRLGFIATTGTLAAPAAILTGALGTVRLEALAGDVTGVTTVAADRFILDTGAGLTLATSVNLLDAQSRLGALTISETNGLTLADLTQSGAAVAALTGVAVTVAAGDLTLAGAVGPFGAAPIQVSLTATAGAIIDANSTGRDIQGGSTVTLSAATGIGAADALEIVATQLAATLTGPGQIRLDNAPTSDVTITGITIGGAPSATNAIDYKQTGRNLAITGAIVSNGGGITIDPPEDISVAALVASAGGAIAATANGTISFQSGGRFDSDGGAIAITADADLNGTGNVVLTQAGTLADRIVDAGGVAAGGPVTVTAVGLTVTDFGIGADGTASDGTITLRLGRTGVAGSLAQAAGAGGNDTAELDGGILDLGIVGAGIAGLEVETSTRLDVTAQGAVTVTETTDGGDLPLGLVDAGGNGVTLRARAGAITDADGGTAPDVANATALSLTAMTSVGAPTDALEVTATSLTVSAGTGINVVGQGAGALQVVSATTTTGPITLANQGDLRLTLVQTGGGDLAAGSVAGSVLVEPAALDATVSPNVLLTALAGTVRIGALTNTIVANLTATANLTDLIGPVTVANGTVRTSGGTNRLSAALTAQAVDLRGNTALAADVAVIGTSSIAFDGISGAFALTLNSPATALRGPVTGLVSLTTDAAGTTTLSGGQLQAATFVLNDAVVLAADTTVTAATVAQLTAGITGAGFDLTLNGPDTRLGAASGIDVLTTDAAGTTTLGVGTLAANTIAFNDRLVLTADTVLTGTAAVTLGGVTGGGFDLTVNAPATGFGGTLNGLDVLVTDAAGTTTLNAATVAANAVTFNDAVAVTGASGVTSAAALRFGGTVNGPASLTASGTVVTFAGAVGGTTPLASLTATGTTSLSLPAVTTTGAQDYTAPAIALGGNLRSTGTASADPIRLNGPVTLGADLEVRTVGGLGDNITFVQTITGADRTLTLIAGPAGDVTLTGLAGAGMTPLRALRVGLFPNTGARDIVITTGLRTSGLTDLFATRNIAGNGLAVGDLRVSGNSAILFGSVGGNSGPLAARFIEFLGPRGTGPYTINGFVFFPRVTEEEISALLEGQLGALNLAAATIYQPLSTVEERAFRKDGRFFPFVLSPFEEADEDPLFTISGFDGRQ